MRHILILKIKGFGDHKVALIAQKIESFWPSASATEVQMESGERWIVDIDFEDFEQVLNKLDLST